MDELCKIFIILPKLLNDQSHSQLIMCGGERNYGEAKIMMTDTAYPDTLVEMVELQKINAEIVRPRDLSAAALIEAGARLRRRHVRLRKYDG